MANNEVHLCSSNLQEPEVQVSDTHSFRVGVGNKKKVGFREDDFKWLPLHDDDELRGFYQELV